jgi:CRISP-associated protein Cas1
MQSDREECASVCVRLEPERPKVDRAVLDFVRGHVFDPADFVIHSDGVSRLNPEMARNVAGLAEQARERECELRHRQDVGN